MPAAPTCEQRWTSERQDDDTGEIYWAIHGAGYEFICNVYGEAHARLIVAVPNALALACAVAEHFEGTDAPLGKMARDFIRKATCS